MGVAHDFGFVIPNQAGFIDTRHEEAVRVLSPLVEFTLGYQIQNALRDELAFIVNLVLLGFFSLNSGFGLFNLGLQSAQFAFLLFPTLESGSTVALVIQRLSVGRFHVICMFCESGIKCSLLLGKAVLQDFQTGHFIIPFKLSRGYYSRYCI